MKDKADDMQHKRKADDLLDDLGRIIYRQRTAGSVPDDDAAIDALVAQLSALEESGVKILDAKGSVDPDPQGAVAPLVGDAPSEPTVAMPPPPPIA